MTRFRSSTFGLTLLVGAIAVAPGCADDPAPDDAAGGSSGTSSTKGGSSGDAGGSSEGGAGGAGAIACMDLGQICHDADDGVDEMGAECHDIGHEGDGEACLEAYDECIEYCMGVLAGGAGGGDHGHEGGAGGEAHHGGAGGESHGGAGGESHHGGAGGA